MITKQTQNIIREILNSEPIPGKNVMLVLAAGVIFTIAGRIIGYGAEALMIAFGIAIVADAVCNWGKEAMTLEKKILKAYEEYVEKYACAIKSKFSHANSEITDDEIIELVKSIRDFEKTFYYPSLREPRVQKGGGKRAVHLKEEHYETFLNSLKEKEYVSNLLTLAKLGANRQDCHIDFFKEKELKLLNQNQKVPSLTNLAVIKMAENNIKLPESLSHHGALYEIAEAYRLETPKRICLGKRKTSEAANEDTSFVRQPFKRVKRMFSHG